MSGKGGKPRRYPGILGPRPDQKQRRQREAQERQSAYDGLSLQEKLERLEATVKLVGGNATRQRTRLELAMAKAGIAIEATSSGGDRPKRMKAKERRAAQRGSQATGE